MTILLYEATEITKKSSGNEMIVHSSCLRASCETAKSSLINAPAAEIERDGKGQVDARQHATNHADLPFATTKDAVTVASAS